MINLFRCTHHPTNQQRWDQTLSEKYWCTHSPMQPKFICYFFYIQLGPNVKISTEENKLLNVNFSGISDSNLVEVRELEAIVYELQQLYSTYTKGA